MYTLYGHDGSTSAVGFSQCGDYFASGGEDSLVLIWKSNLVDYDDSVVNEAPISFGNLGNTMKSNIQTQLVSDQKKTGNRPTSECRSDMLSSERYLKYDDKMPEEEFYLPPEQQDPLPEASLENANIPLEVASVLSKVVNQLDLLSSTLAVLE